MFVERCFLCVVLVAGHDRKASHFSGVCWKQFMILLGKDSCPCGESTRVSELPLCCLVSSVVGGSEVSPPLGDLGHALFSRAQLVLWSYSSVASRLSHTGLTKFEWGLSHELAPPGAILRQGGPIR